MLELARAAPRREPVNLVPDGDHVDADALRITVVEADLGDIDRADVRDATVDADIVFNLAGQVSHVDSMDDPLFDLDGQHHEPVPFLELLRRENPGATVVFTSTRQIFGKPRYLPVDEDHPVAPVDVNGITKYATEQLHLLYHDVYGLRVDRGAAHERVRPASAPARRPPGLPADLHPARARRRADHRCSVTVSSSATASTSTTSSSACCSRRRTREAPGQIFNVGNDERLSLRRDRRRGGRRGRRRPRGARAVAARPRRHRHRLVLRRLVEGEAHARLGAAHFVRRRDRAHARVLPRARAPWYL